MLESSVVGGTSSKRCILLLLNAQNTSGLNLHDKSIQTELFLCSKLMYLLHSTDNGFCSEI